MLKYVSLILYVVGCLAHKPDSPNKTKSTDDTKKFPPYPGSVTVMSLNNGTTNQTNRTTRQHSTFTPSRGSQYALRMLPKTSFDGIVTTPTNSSVSNNSTSDNSTSSGPKLDMELDFKCESMFGCLDCGTALVCRPTAKGLVKTFTLPCPHTAPYCSFASGTCSTEPDHKCSSPDPFICPEDGYFPDPNNCTTYHTCNDFEAEMFKCADGHVFDPIKNECSLGNTCNYTVNCAGVSESKLKMGETQFFTYCSGGLPLLVSRCPEEYKLNSTTQICEPNCQHNGLIADVKDCTKYYKCTMNQINVAVSIPTKQHLTCPIDEVYEPSTHHCVPKAMSTCKKY